MYNIRIYYNTGKTTDGRAYKVPHTYDFGYDLTIQFTGNTENNVKFDKIQNCHTLQYDPTKAAIKLNQKGNLTLYFFD